MGVEKTVDGNKKLLNIQTSPISPRLPSPRIHSNLILSPKSTTYCLKDFVRPVQKVDSPINPHDFDLIIDTRPFNNYSQSHIKDAVNICIPTTLLKRNSMNVHSLLNLANIPSFYKQLLLNKLSVDNPQSSDKLNILFYDKKSTENSISLILFQTINKFLVFNDYFTVSYLDGGFLSTDINAAESNSGANWNQTSPVDDSFESSPSKSLSPVGDLHSLSPASVLSDEVCCRNENCLSGFILPSATNFKTKFINSIKKNTILPKIDTVQKIPDSSNYSHDFRLPSDCKSTKDVDSIANLPVWLRAIIYNQSNQSIISYFDKNFTKIELLETSRLNSLITNDSHEAKSKSQLSLPLNFPRSHTMSSPTICSPSGLCPDCDKINYAMPRGIEYGFKNRYKNIWPYEHSRVKLACEHDNSIDESDDYFNANFVNCDAIVNTKFKYIATQNPLVDTIKDFWNIVKTHNIKLIINLDISKMDYLDGNPDPFMFKVEEYYTDESLIVRKINNEIYHFQFLKWPDFGVPQDFDSLLKLIRIKNEIFDSFEDKEASNTILVHCLAGCGRTGVFITLDSLIDCFHLDKELLVNSQSDLVYRLVQHQRTQRIAMVQNLDQYIVCYEILLHFLASSEKDERKTKHTLLEQINYIGQSLTKETPSESGGKDYFLSLKQTYV